MKITSNFIKKNLFYEEDGQLKLTDTRLGRRDNKWIMNKARYNSEFGKSNEPIRYLNGNDEISFIPISIGFKGNVIPVDSVEGTLIGNSEEVEGYHSDATYNNKGIVFKKVFGNSVNIGIITENTVFRKIIKINSNPFGVIPTDTKYIEITFLVETNSKFVINGTVWDDKSVVIKDAIRFGDCNAEIKEPLLWTIAQEDVIKYKGDDEIVIKKGDPLYQNIQYRLEMKDGRIYLIKMIPVDYLSDFPVYTDITITLDDASLFESGITSDVSCAALDSSHFVIAFQDDDNKGKVIAGSISDTTITITADTASLFESGTTISISCAALDISHFVIAFRDVGDASKGKVIAGSVSDTTITITADTASVFDSGGIAADVSCAALDSSHFVIAFQVDDFKGRVIAGSVSGVTITITADTASVFESGTTSYISCAALDSSHFVIAFRDGGDAGKGKVIAGSVSDTTITITVDTGSDFESGSTMYISCAALDSSHFVIAFQDTGDADRGKVIAGSVSGVTITITADTASVFESGSTIYISCIALDISHFVIAFRDIDDVGKGKVIAGEEVPVVPANPLICKPLISHDIIKKAKIR